MEILNFTLFIFLLPTCLSLDVLELSINYFSQRNVKCLCVLTCDKAFARRKFAKAANGKTISVGVEDITHVLDYENIKRCVEQKYSNIGIVIDANCNNATSILIYASQEMLFNSPRKWLVIVQRTNVWNETIKKTSRYKSPFKVIDESMYTLLNNLNMSVDTDMTIAIQDGLRSVNYYDVYNYGKIQGGKLKFINIGKWNSRKELNLNYSTKYKYYRRWNFEELKLRMVIVMSPGVKNIGSVVTSREPVPGVSVVTRTSSMVLLAVAEIHNISYEYITVDRWIGNYDRNSSIAVTNSLYFRKADISPVIRMLNITFEYLDILYPPLTSIETRYYYRIPTYGPGKFENQLLRPLSTGAWLCVLAVGVLCILLLMTSSKIEKRPSSMQFAVFSVIASFCQQFFEDNGEMATRRTTTAGKLTILVTGASCVLIYNYYTSSVVSWLLSAPPPSINSLKELLDSPLELIYEDIGYTRSWLQMPDYYYNKRNAKIEDELRQRKVLNKKKGDPLLVPLERGIEMVKAGGFAYHTEVNSANDIISRSFTQNELCELGSLQSMEKTLLYVCLQKNSPYKEFFVWSLLRLRERGVVHCIQYRTRALDVSCEGSVPRALALGGAAPAFVLLATGYVLGISIMLIERILLNSKSHRYNTFIKLKNIYFLPPTPDSQDILNKLRHRRMHYARKCR